MLPFELQQSNADDEFLIDLIRRRGHDATYLWLDSTLITDRGLRATAQCPRLKDLSCSDTRITNDGASVVAELELLETINFSATRIDDRFAEPLARCRNLKHLWIIETNCGDAVLAAACRLEGLTSLEIDETRIEHASLCILSVMNSLELFTARRTARTTEIFSWLEPHRRIERLSLSDLQLDERSDRFFQVCEMLADVTLERCEFEPRQVAAIAALPTAERFQFDGTNFGDSHAAALPAITAEHPWLHLKAAPLTNQGLRSLLAGNQWGGLFLASTLVDDLGLSGLEEQTGLAFLDLSGTRITDAAVDVILRIPALHGVYLDRTSITAAGIARLLLANRLSAVCFRESRERDLPALHAAAAQACAAGSKTTLFL